MEGKLNIDTRFTDELGNKMFAGIAGGLWEGDVTLLSVARWLLHSRGFPLTITVVSDDDYIPPTTAENELLLAVDIGRVRFSECKESYDKAAEVSGMKHLKDISRWFTEMARKMFRSGSHVEIEVYCDTDQHRAVVLADRCNTHLFHFIAGSLPSYIKWAFKDQPVSNDEMQVLMKIADPTRSWMEGYRLLNAMADQYDMRDAMIEFCLGNFENRTRQGLYSRTKEAFDEYVRMIRSTTDELHRLYKKRNELEVQLNSLALAPESSGAMVEYFKSNKKLRLVGSPSVGDELLYLVRGYMDSFDPAMYQALRENSVSYLTNTASLSTPFKTDDCFLLLDALFIEESVRLKLWSLWSLSDYSITPLRGGGAEEVCGLVEDYLPNPHLVEYGCVGSFGEALNSAISRKDYIMAVDITSAENGNVNLRDSVVTPRFIEQLFTLSGKFIELPDGTSVTVADAIKWLKQRS